MNRFYIKKLMVSGGGHHTSVIDFKPGLNFILGPSNTGKSLVMRNGLPGLYVWLYTEEKQTF